MHTFTATLMAAVFAVHSALGCCWHHDHSHAAASGSPADSREHACAHTQHQGHQHEDGAPGEDEPQHNGPCGGACEEGACVFVDCGKPLVPDDGHTVPSPDIVLPPLMNGASFLALAGTVTVPRALAPPVRLHLSKRVLLI